MPRKVRKPPIQKRAKITSPFLPSIVHGHPPVDIDLKVKRYGRNLVVAAGMLNVRSASKRPYYSFSNPGWDMPLIKAAETERVSDVLVAASKLEKFALSPHATKDERALAPICRAVVQNPGKFIALIRELREDFKATVRSSFP